MDSFTAILIGVGECNDLHREEKVRGWVCEHGFIMSDREMARMEEAASTLSNIISDKHKLHRELML